MRLGVALPFTDAGGAPLGPRTLADAARRIEAHGFDHVWALDAHNRGFVLPDPFAALAVAATVTERVELGSCIVQVPLRHPFDLAHRVATTHLLSGGRLLFGVGSGSTRNDFEAFGLDFDRRFAMLDHHLGIVRRLLAGEDVDGARLEPWPATRPGPPVLVGAFANGRWIDRAATEFDGWIGSARSTDVATLRAGLARFRAAGGGRAVAANLAAGRPDLAEALAELAEAGFDDTCCLVEHHTDADLARLRAMVPPR